MAKVKIPGETNFQRNNLGRTLSGASGIVPYKTPSLQPNIIPQHIKKIFKNK